LELASQGVWEFAARHPIDRMKLLSALSKHKMKSLLNQENNIANNIESAMHGNESSNNSHVQIHRSLTKVALIIDERNWYRAHFNYFMSKKSVQNTLKFGDLIELVPLIIDHSIRHLHMCT